MITITVQEAPVLEQQADCLGMFLEEAFDYAAIKPIEKLVPRLRKIMEDREFTGSAGSLLVVPVIQDASVQNVIFVGLGDKKDGHIPIENYRRGLGNLIKKTIDLRCSSVTMQLPSAELFDSTDENVAKQTAIIANMAAYYFDEFITDPKRKLKTDITLLLSCENQEKEVVKRGVEQGEIIADAVNQARHWVDLPPMQLTPVDLAEQAKKIAKEYGLSLTLFNEEEVKQMGMGGLSAVSRGSDRECQLVILEYKTEAKDAPTIGFVGKGITFDSGGLSLKPAGAMETMKEDMAGAAAVLSSMKAIAQLKPKVNVVAVVPLAENLPSGKALMPGDIITFYNGKTAEVKNTDAEGRLILADALSYAVKHFNLDALVDLATLTGACPYALGHFYSALLSQHPELSCSVEEAAKRTGDKVWALPMDNDFRVAIKSEVADISNTGSGKYLGGTITAAFFLSNFVGDVPWAHLDIAGTAFNVPDISYYRSGATGAGVRLLIDLAMQWQ